jgi:hypothetical protein
MSTMPMLCRGLAIVPAEHGLLIEGGPRRQWVPGASAATLLPKVLALLDGQHDTETICGELGLTARQLDQVLGVLGEYGLLEDADAVGGDTAPGPAAPAHVAAYLSRNLSATGGHQSTGAALAALGESAVALVGDCPALELIEADLRETGIGVVTRVVDGTLDAADLAALAGGRSLVVACDDGKPSGVLERTVAACAGTGLTVLRIAAGPGHADVGPAFRPGDTACPRCLRRGLAEAGCRGYHRDGRAGRRARLGAEADPRLAGWPRHGAPARHALPGLRRLRLRLRQPGRRGVHAGLCLRVAVLPAAERGAMAGPPVGGGGRQDP